MKRSSNGRIVGIAIAASIAVHLAFACVVRVSPVTAAPEQQPRTLTVSERPRPKPTPKPTPPPPRKQQTRVKKAPTAARPRINTVRLPKSGPRTGAVTVAYTPGPLVTPDDTVNTGTVDATPGPSLPPAPTPTPKPACSAPDIPAKAIDAVTPEAPPDVPSSGVTAKVEVALDATGAVVGTKMYTSTGYMQLDHAALEAARESRYAPEEHDCKNIPGSYLFTVDFQD
jgi:TonB family protein